jgi:hypothetical protein
MKRDGVLGQGIDSQQLPSLCSPRPVRKLANQPIKSATFLKSTMSVIFGIVTIFIIFNM